MEILEKKSKDYLSSQLKRGIVVLAKNSIPKDIYNYIKEKSFIAELNRQYVFIKSDSETDIDSFKNNLWIIVFQFLNISFPEGCYVRGHYAYKFLLEDFSISAKQIVISTKEKSNRMINLLDQIEILASYDADYSTKPIYYASFLKTKIPIIKPELLLINSTVNDYKQYKSEILGLIKSNKRDDLYIETFFTYNSNPILLARFIGALIQIQDFALKAKLEAIYRIQSSTVKIENPFDDYLLGSVSERPPYIIRFELSMLKAIQFLKKLDKPRRLRKRITNKEIDKVLVDDTYHNLTIEGYTVTRALIEALQEGQSNNIGTLKDQLAAKGFMNAIAFIKTICTRNFEINQSLPRRLYEELWKPSINANFMKGELDFFRRHMVAIKGASYVPPSHEKLPYLMDELFDSIKEIDNGFALGIFLHYFYVSIHPHGDGNGRISRFLMNLAFIRDKYKWLTIPCEDKKKYFAALERSQLEDDISYFAKYIQGL